MSVRAAGRSVQQRGGRLPRSGAVGDNISNDAIGAADPQYRRRIDVLFDEKAAGEADLREAFDGVTRPRGLIVSERNATDGAPKVIGGFGHGPKISLVIEIRIDRDQ
jgi:hypothetical protein